LRFGGKGQKGGRATHVEAEAEQVEDLVAQAAARVCKGGEAGLFGGDGRGDGLLGLAVDELAKVEGPSSL